MTLLQAFYLRRELQGFEVVRTLKGLATMVAAGAVFGVVAYATWWMLDDALGRGLVAQIVSVGAALVAGFAVYFGIVLVAKVPEAGYLRRLVTRRP
jgi:hypothetical protein